MSARNFEVYSSKKAYGSVHIYKDQSKIGVSYHDTEVVQLKGLIITLNNGGWLTVTTKAVMNRALRQIYQIHGIQAPFVRQTKGVWFVDFANESIEYKNGMNWKITKPVTQ